MGRRFSFFWAAVLIVFMVWPAASPRAAGQAVPPGARELTGHRALYTLKLGFADASSGIVDARGAMMYRFTDGCDGWTVENRTVMNVLYEEGEEVETIWSFTSWEAKDGLSYRFRVHQTSNGETILRLKGTAVLNAGRKNGVARFVEPEVTSIELPNGTLFPTDHLIALFSEAKRGTSRFAKVVFDGARLDLPDEISAFMGKAAPGENRALMEAFGLDDMGMWKMRLAFFQMSSKEPLPDFEIDIHYREDGIAGKIEQDFGDFSFALTPDRIEILPKPDC